MFYTADDLCWALLVNAYFTLLMDVIWYCGLLYVLYCYECMLGISNYMFYTAGGCTMDIVSDYMLDMLLIIF